VSQQQIAKLEDPEHLVVVQSDERGRLEAAAYRSCSSPEGSACEPL
jgi:hypothetical protein